MTMVRAAAFASLTIIAAIATSIGRGRPTFRSARAVTPAAWESDALESTVVATGDVYDKTSIGFAITPACIWSADKRSFCWRFPPLHDPAEADKETRRY